MSSSSSSSSSGIWEYDVFISFRGDDLRYNFVSHFVKELDRKFIKTFKDMEIEKGLSLDPVLNKAIKGSKIAVVLFSENYASSGWCLNELLEIVKCHKEMDQVLIPIFHGVDPSHVRKQTGEFGKVFEDTCKKNTEELKNQWKKALTEVANMVGTHFQDNDNEAKRIEVIASDLLRRLKSPSKDYEKFVGIEDHIAKLRLMLHLESREVKRVGIWGPSGIGKTTIARVLYNQLSPHFGGSIYIDKHLISRGDYKNLADYNTSLHLQECFLSKLLDEEGIMVDDLDAVKEKLKHQNVLIFIDDLDDQLLLDVLAGGDEWFGPGSRILAITKDKHILKGQGIKCVYEVGIPSEKVALQIFCQSAFKQDSPPDSRYMELASGIAMHAGGLPLGLILLGSSLRGRDKDFWEKMFVTFKDLDGKIEQALRVSYDALEKDQHKEIFRHIACFFNGDEINYIKLMLADIDYDIGIGLDILIDKSLIHVIQSRNKSFVQMHCLVEEMGKEVVRSQSQQPEKREFLIRAKDVCDVLENKTDSENVLGISLNLNEIDHEFRIHKKAFKKMRRLRFLRFYTNGWKLANEVQWISPERIDGFPSKLKLLSWPGFPMKQLPAGFRTEMLVELRMPKSKILEELWKGMKSLKNLKDMDLSESQNLKEVPDLSQATNLETLNLNGCSSLVELPSSILNLNKLTDLNLAECTKLERLPTGDLESLTCLNLVGCLQLKNFPAIANKLSELIINKTAFEIFPSKLRLENLVELSMEHILSERLWEGVQPLTNLKTIKLLGSINLREVPDLSMATSLETLNLNNCSSLVELTLSSIENLNKLTTLEMIGCSSLETLPTGINLESLYRLNLNGCLRLRSFPDISCNISLLFLNQTAIEEVPSQINKFSSLEALEMWDCKELRCISSRIFKLQNLEEVFFSKCEKLAEVRWPEEVEGTDNAVTNFSLISFTDCFNLNHETFIQRSASKCLILPGEVPEYFTYRSTGSVLTIPLQHHSSRSQQSFLDFKVCVVVSDGSKTVNSIPCYIDIEVRCQFRNKHGNYSNPVTVTDLSFHQKYNHQIIFDCQFPLNQECDQVEVEFHLPYNVLKLERCGMRLLDDSTLSPATQNEADESRADNDEEECGVTED